MKLQRVVDGERQTLHVPSHAQLDTGTSRAIFRLALRYIAEADLHSHFFSD